MASKGVNKVILVGNLGQDPEVRYMPNGNAVANLSIATSESWKDQQGQMQDRTEWHRLTMYRRLAEVAGEYLRKGSQIYVEGKLQTRKWQDQQGQDKYTTEVIVDQMQMLGGKGQSNESQDNTTQHRGQQNQRPQGGSNSQGYQGNGQQYGNQNQVQGNANLNPDGSPKSPAQMQGKAPMAEPDFDFDDDIPFGPIAIQHRALLNCI
tara:strand:+ start:3925 stop:4545 length:621 start_codon:yes stop_codon:yes gene_type:complete